MEPSRPLHTSTLATCWRHCVSHFHMISMRAHVGSVLVTNCTFICAQAFVWGRLLQANSQFINIDSLSHLGSSQFILTEEPISDACARGTENLHVRRQSRKSNKIAKICSSFHQSGEMQAEEAGENSESPVDSTSWLACAVVHCITPGGLEDLPTPDNAS